MRPSEAYRKGYEKGQTDKAGGVLAELTLSMTRDDPGSHFAAGYRDGAGKKKFNPPSDEARKPVRKQSVESETTDLEKAWYGLCGSSDFIPQDTVDGYVSALQAAGKAAAIVVGLHDFTGLTCPRCGSKGQVKIHFLGRIEHAPCGWTAYMGTGSYIGFQISQILHTGLRAGGSAKEDSDKKGVHGGWIHGIFTFLFIGAFRAMLAAVLIPLHTIVALFQAKQTTADIVTRAVVLVVFAIAAWVGVHQSRIASQRQLSGQNFPGRFSVGPPARSQPPNTAQIRPFIGTWKIMKKGRDTGEVWTFLPNGRYEGRAPERGSFSGPYSLHSNTIVIKFPEIELTALIVNAGRNNIRLRVLKVVELSGATSSPNDEYELVRTNQPDVTEGFPLDRRVHAAASSTLPPQQGSSYSPDNILDNNLSTAWVEGVRGPGIGQWIQINFPSPTLASSFEIYAGYGKNEVTYTTNNRVKRIRLDFSSGQSQEIALGDYMKWQAFQVVPSTRTVSVRVTILDVYPGTKYDDTAISEIRIH